MSKPVLSPSEFVGACSEIAARSKRTIEDVAARLESAVEIRTPERTATHAERSERLAYAVALARELGVSVPEAEAVLAKAAA